MFSSLKLTDLPPEIHCEIFKHLSPKSQRQLAKTNKQFAHAGADPFVRKTTLLNEFMREGRPINWRYLSTNPALTPALIRQFVDEGRPLKWYCLSENSSLTPALIRQFIAEGRPLNWCWLSANPSLTPTLIRQFIDEGRPLDWENLSRNPKLLLII